MKSIAIYYKVKEEEKTSPKSDSNLEENEECSKMVKTWKPIESVDIEKYPDVGEVHVNVWKVYKGKLFLDPIYYMDFGIKVSFKVEQIRLYVPFMVDKDRKIDLCSQLMNNRALLSAVFNDEMLPDPCPNSCYCHVENQISKRDFFLYQIGDDNIEYKDFTDENGTYLTIKINGYPDETKKESYKDKTLYVRFRLCIVKNNQIAISEHISNDLIQAAFSITDLFDLRFNEIREINPKIQEKMNTDGFERLLFDKLHVFYIADTREDVENCSSLKIDSRLLEKDHWVKYEPENALVYTHFIAHHWRKRRKNFDQPIRDASVFFSTRYPKLDGFRLLAYLFVVVLLGWAGSMLTFKFHEITCTLEQYKSLLRPIAIVIMILYVLGIAIKNNIGYQCMKIFRKR